MSDPPDRPGPDPALPSSHDRPKASGPTPTPDSWAMVEDLFARALEVPATDRADFLDATTDDPTLRAEVESLLAAHEGESGFIDGPPPWSGDDAAPDGAKAGEIPERIGPYLILSSLGRGGMGQVYLAERQAPGFTRKVALKVIRRGLDTDDLLERFSRERQILAHLDHPNIARLYDVGATDDGRPFYVMEYVDGRPVLEYCDSHESSLKDRLALFRAICDAVQYAHGNLVVHRDLKPANILISEDGTPKLLDFGIARLLDDRAWGPGAHLTRPGSALLTPEYAAPEQIRGEPVTTACDVYSLGVLLYELLSGRHPYADPADPGSDPARLALTVDPPSPSRAIHDTPAKAARRGVSLGRLSRLLEGDLDNIVLKAVRKEPEERYASVQSFAEDLDRYASGLPVRARPATLRYRVRKYIVRHRIAVATVTLVFGILAAATALTLYQSARIREESARVALERDKALEVRSFLLEMFGATGPDQPADSVTARQMLDRRRATLEDAYADDPETGAEMRMVLAEGYERLGLLDDAEPLARHALESRVRLFGDTHPDVVVSLNVVGWLRRQSGDLAGADSLLRQSVDLGRVVFGHEADNRMARVLNDLGVVRMDRGDPVEASTLLEESLAMRRQLLDGRHIGIAITTSNLAAVLYNRGDFEAAVRMAESAAIQFRDLLGVQHQRTLIVLQNLAAMRAAWGDAAGAAQRLGRILDVNIERFGEDHPTVAWNRTMLAYNQRRLGRFDEAVELLEHAIETFTRAFPNGHRDLVLARRVLGDTRLSLGDTVRALQDYREGLESANMVLGPSHDESAVLTARIAGLEEAAGNFDSARRGFRQAASIATAALGASHSTALELQLQWLEFLIRRDDHAEAEQQLLLLDASAADAAQAGSALQDRLVAARRALGF